MVNGYDHLRFLLGVIFFLHRLRDVAVYVTCFAIEHSVTLLAGVLSSISVNPCLVDALIGFSVVYKAFGFGLVHGFGLATKPQNFALSSKGLITNMISFSLSS
jgi:hypothetical protein